MSIRYRRLAYEHHVQLEQWATKAMFERQEVSEQQLQSDWFDKVLAHVRDMGYKYVLTEVEERVIERRD